MQNGGVPRTDHAFLDGPHPRAFVHRGWHCGELAGMENSLTAFRRAVTEGYHYVETDVHATSDGTVVVHHDSLLDRTTDGVGPIAEQPWSAVRRAKVGGREPIAALADVLEELPDTRFNIDIKADRAVEPAMALLRRMNALPRVAIASFSERRLARARLLGGAETLTSLGPRSVATLWAAGRLIRRAGRPLPGLMAQIPVRHGPMVLVNERMVRVAHRAGIEVHVWTVDEPAEMNRLLDLGVDGLLSDRPDLLRAELSRRGVWLGTS